MSRIGKRPVIITDGVLCNLEGKRLVFQGPKGQLSIEIPSMITVNFQEGRLFVEPQGKSKEVKSLWGYFRSALSNAVLGVSQGFERFLELSGVGYRAKMENGSLTITVGFSHPVKISPPVGITLAVEGDTKIKISGMDKQKVGELAAKIRAIRPPEPYKGKGIKYQGEIIRKKAGKAGKVGAAFGAK